MSEKKVALVTGSSEGGIGFSFCKSLLGRGYIVYATARKLESIQALQHANVKKIVLDVTNDEHVQNVVQTIIDEEGHIDVLINNAAMLSPGPIIDYTPEKMKEVYDTNVFSILRLSRAVIPHMAKRNKGVVINMGSTAGEFPTPWMGIYDSSKGAVRILTEVLSLECRPFNIHVMLVAPGAVKSDMIKKNTNYQIPPGSIYGGFTHNIRQRMEAASDSYGMPTDDFAEDIISKALSKSPPSYVLTGGKAYLFKMLSVLPRRWFLSIVWNMFSKPEEKSKTA